MLSVYLSTLIAGSIGFAFLFESYSFSFPPLMLEQHHHSSSWFLTVCALITGVLFLTFIYQDVSRWITNQWGQTPSESTSHLIGVQGMTCGGCVRKLERTLSDSDLVSYAYVSRDPDQVQIQGNGSYQDMCKLIQSAGFTPHSPSS